MPKSTKTTQSTTTRTRTRQSPATSATPTTATLDHADIAHRAYELFLGSGAMHGRDLEHWLQAESELRKRSVTAGR